MADEQGPKQDEPTGEPHATATGPRSCQWCGAVSPASATQCSGCGAALATRESLGGLIVPGVTAVHPALEAYDAQPRHLPRNSPGQGIAGGTIAAAALGGPAGIAALGGLAAVAAVEYLGAGAGHAGDTTGIDGVGRPSEAALEMARRLDAEGEPAATEATGSDPATPSSEEAG